MLPLTFDNSGSRAYRHFSTIRRIVPSLARDGDPEEIYFEETDTSFAIGWRGDYRIDSDAFVYIDVARQQCPSPLHQQGEHNMAYSAARGKGDVSILR